jgi:hypothetical protein
MMNWISRLLVATGVMTFVVGGSARHRATITFPGGRQECRRPHSGRADRSRNHGSAGISAAVHAAFRRPVRMANAVDRAGRAADRSSTSSFERSAISLKQGDHDDGDGVQGGNAHDDESRIGDDGQPARDHVPGRKNPATGVRRVLRLARSPTTAAARCIRTEAPQLAVVKQSSARFLVAASRSTRCHSA